MTPAYPMSVTASEQQHSRLDMKSMKAEALPFTIRVVSNASDLEKAVRIRHAAYMRHVPAFAQALKMPERSDSELGVVVLLAESKFDGSPIGTMRIQTNEFNPLTLEQSVNLPHALTSQRLAEATRLGVTQERVGRMVTTALFKAFFLYCQKQRVDWMVITARSPVDRHYDRLMFKDVDPEMGYIPFKHVGNLPHRVMSFEVGAAHDLWLSAKHPLFNFVFRTYHADIDVSATTLYESRIPQRATTADTAMMIA
ncbi:hypothetical protein KTQ42_20370 [Noviherbaspirillum sp. L7-7A]|uniref:N-acyl amino acid synthase FeeM domain-containing protein n=1 Tax=Noviherbaspirillum sp. L7-7A TaxID=2850560 RepID=UPI001C2C0632|nr:hypothetical protein [Noviherbaspirillum sp. L7-7A]MBV0881640.1 hypothetical protein [Noviherbaspirillum sp. L7-7A]